MFLKYVLILNICWNAFEQSVLRLQILYFICMSYYYDSRMLQNIKNYTIPK